MSSPPSTHYAKESNHEMIQIIYNNLSTQGDMWLTCGKYSVRTSSMVLRASSAFFMAQLSERWLKGENVALKGGLPELILRAAEKEPFDENGLQELDVEMMHVWCFLKSWKGRGILSDPAKAFTLYPRMYYVADYFQMPSLKEFTATLFDQALGKHPPSEHSHKAIEMVYTLPEIDDGRLRKMVLKGVVSWMDGTLRGIENVQFWESDEMVKTLDIHPQYVLDVTDYIVQKCKLERRPIIEQIDLTEDGDD